MKVSVIGCGNVGMSVFSSLRSLHEISELVLINRSLDKVNAEVSDYLDADVIDYEPKPKLSAGTYEAAAGSDIIIYTAGAGQKSGQDRLDLVKANAEIVKTVFGGIKDQIQNSIIICISNPVDILTSIIQQVTGIPKNRVIGSGTLLDTARLKRFIAGVFDINAQSVDALVIGEHGMSSVVLWSNVRIANYDIDAYAKETISPNASMKKTMMDQYMKKVAYKLIEQKGSTAYGVAQATKRLVMAIIHDTKEILPASTMLLDKYDCVEDSCASIPCVFSRNGIIDTVRVNFSDEEKEQFKNSVAIIKSTIDSIE